MLARSSNICQSWNDGTCHWPFGQCLYRHSCEKCEGEHRHVNCPFQTSQSDSQHSWPATLPRVNASGVSVVARSFQPTLRNNFVHNVDIPGSVQFSNVLFPVLVNVVMSTQDVCDKPCVTSTQASCPSFSSFIDCLQQHLVSPSRVTSINAEKLWPELYFHPDQTLVDYVISGLSNGFHLGFNLLAVSFKSASQNMPSVPLQPSAIDQYLQLHRS